MGFGEEDEDEDEEERHDLQTLRKLKMSSEFEGKCSKILVKSS